MLDVVVTMEPLELIKEMELRGTIITFMLARSAQNQRNVINFRRKFMPARYAVLVMLLCITCFLRYV